MTEDRFVDIESKIAFQEDAIQELSNVVYQQQRKLDKLEAICESLVQHILDLKESVAEGRISNEKPPHY